MRFALAFVAAICAGCAMQTAPMPLGALSNDARLLAAGHSRNPIRHVVLVIQENRSFNDIFMGFPGATTSAYGRMKDGRRVPLRAITFAGPDIDHYWKEGIVDWDSGKMDGFGLNPITGTSTPSGRYAYSYLRRSLVRPYWQMARRYALADRMFSTEFGPSFTAHLFLTAATASIDKERSLADLPSGTPWTCDAAAGTTTPTVNVVRAWRRNGPFPCLTQFRTIVDELDEAGITWRYYAPAASSTFGSGKMWTTPAAIRSIRYGTDFNNVVTPQTTVLADAARGTLPQFSFVLPDAAGSDHAGTNSDEGPSWVAAVVNAIGTSKYWKSTAIVVVWDEWGGWYDPVPPPQLDFRGLGIRVPCIVISPYAKAHYVSKTQYEFGSIMKLVETVFSLPTLGSRGVGFGYTDARANGMSDVFDFKRQPRDFARIDAPYPAAHFASERPSFEPDDY